LSRYAWQATCSSRPRARLNSCAPPGASSALPSFPTRRSSDLEAFPAIKAIISDPGSVSGVPASRNFPGSAEGSKCEICRPAPSRSEEHTSELQSRFDLVCRLLLEKQQVIRRVSEIDHKLMRVV